MPPACPPPSSPPRSTPPDPKELSSQVIATTPAAPEPASNQALAPLHRSKNSTTTPNTKTIAGISTMSKGKPNSTKSRSANCCRSAYQPTAQVANDQVATFSTSVRRPVPMAPPRGTT
jgi:hypothetical protein